MVCFSVWGAFGNVTFDNQTLLPREQAADGRWMPLRFKGPADYPSWRRSWAVFESAMVMIGAAAPESLKAYRKGICKLSE